MADKVATIARPSQMRRLLHSQIKRSLTIAIGGAFVAAFVVKVVMVDPRKKAYADFYRTYDAEKSFETMRKKGLFQSCPST